MTRSIIKNGSAFVLIGIVVLAGLIFINSNRSSALSMNPQTVLGQNTTTSSLTWNFQKIGLLVPSRKLNLLLADASATTEYIVGIRSTNTQEPTLIAGEVIFHNPQSRLSRMVSHITDWPRERINIQPGSIEISGLSQAKGSVLIYLTVSPGTEVNVDTPNGPVVRATPANSLMVHNGEIIPREVEGIRTLVARLERPNPAADAAQIVRVQANRFFATPKGLAANLMNLKRPSFPPAEINGEVETVILKIAIDEEGIVKEIIPVKGSKEFSDTAQQAVREWKFKPFLADDKPIAVEASVVFFFGKDGTVSSPIFNEMSK